MPTVCVAGRPSPVFWGELFGFIHSADGNGGVGAILLNAGLLHNVGPFRLYNHIADALAGAGITTARIDQSGKGESPSRDRTTDAEALIKDYDDVAAHLAQRGVKKIILVGLCTAADDALELASKRNAVAGIVMLDGYAPRDLEYFLRRYTQPVRELKRLFGSLRRRLRPSSPNDGEERIDIRNWRSRDVMLADVAQFLNRGGRLLAVFSGGVKGYYNHCGQLSRSVGGSPGLAETYLSTAAHTFPVSADRARLVERIVEWAKAEFPSAR